METTNGGPEAAAEAGERPAESGNSPAIRASDRERDAVVQRVQQAFAEGRLDDTEFDERMRAALTARTHAHLTCCSPTCPRPRHQPRRPCRKPGTRPVGSP